MCLRERAGERFTSTLSDIRASETWAKMWS